MKAYFQSRFTKTALSFPALVLSTCAVQQLPSPKQ